MTELPKSVREQLARAPLPATPHPDADLLTAYGENSLGAAEQERVTEHLAACAECREVLFLAQPQAEQAPVVAKPVPTQRFSWMAWASAAAVILVVGSAVLLRQEKVAKLEAPVTAGTVAKPAAPPPIGEKKAEPAPATVTPARTRESDRLAIVAPASPPSPVAVAPSKEVAAASRKQKDDNFKAGGRPANENIENSQSVITARQEIPGPANAAVANVTNLYTAQDTAPAAPPAEKVARKAELARNAAVSSTALGYSQQAGVRPELGRPHWRISKTGGLERSYLEDQWKPVLVGADVSFRVISVVENMVWAGGNHGALWVSRNDGVDWMPVKIDSTADVISIRFDDEMNGRMQTSDGKVWKTADGGKSWMGQ